MPKTGLIMTTLGWNHPVYNSKVQAKNNPYGKVYAGVIRGLIQNGWRHQPLADMSTLLSISNSNNPSDGLNELVVAAAKNNPDLYMHDNYSGYNHLWFGAKYTFSRENGRRWHGMVGDVLVLLREQLFNEFKGRIERVYSKGTKNWVGEISLKDQLFTFATDMGIPTPETIIFRSDWRGLSYESLSKMLTGKTDENLMVKLIYSSGGKGVYSVSNSSDLTYFWAKEEAGNFAVVQRKLDSPNDYPYSIRVVSWGSTPIGAALLINQNHRFCSNSHQGGLAFDLAMPWQNPRTDISGLDSLTDLEIRKVREIGNWCGIDIDSRTLPEELSFYSEIIGSHNGSMLLRGDDYMFEHGEGMIIESNMHPGPPGSGMFGDIHGIKAQKGAEVKLAIDDILQAIFLSKRIERT